MSTDVFDYNQGNLRARRKYVYIRNIGNTPLVLDYVYITNTNEYLNNQYLQPLPTNMFHHILYPWQIFQENYTMTDYSIYYHVDSLSGQVGEQLEYSTEPANLPNVENHTFENKPPHPYSVYRNPYSYHIPLSTGYIEYPSGVNITGSTHPSGYNTASNEAEYQPMLFNRPFLNNWRLGRKSKLRPYYNIDGSVSGTADQMFMGLQCRIKKSKPGTYEGKLIVKYHFFDSWNVRHDKETVVNLSMTLLRSTIAEMDLTLEDDIFSIEGALLDNAEVVEIF